jgi:hypothetical protein
MCDKINLRRDQSHNDDPSGSESEKQGITQLFEDRLVLYLALISG